jgi:hypothetical protein
MMDAFRDIDIFSIPFSFWITRKNKQTNKKRFIQSYHSFLGAFLTLVAVTLSLLFIIVLIYRMFNCYDDLVSSSKLLNDFSIYNNVSLEEVGFMPNINIRPNNFEDIERLVELGIATGADLNYNE